MMAGAVNDGRIEIFIGWIKILENIRFAVSVSLANAFLNEREGSIHFVALSPSCLLVVFLDGETHFWPRT
jgi:hypothetical protein